MRTITKIVIHCSATREGQAVTVKDIARWHKDRGYREIGYHYVVYLDGSIHKGRDEEKIGAHVLGHNTDSVGICYVGGLDKFGKSKDTRTDEQKKSLIKLIGELKERYPRASLLGHRDLSPDINGDGKIDKWEWLKDCPCFDVRKEYL